jgi:cobalt-zinc-cadmium efflux system outer membrane protein
MKAVHPVQVLLVCACVVTGCTRVPQLDDGGVSSIVANRIDSQAEWRHGCDHEDQKRAYIQNLSLNELTSETAIQIALLNNPKIQAVFEELGIAQADLVEAGLLSNPTFAIEVRYPPVQGLHTNIEYLITSSLLDFFLIPLRKKLASTEFEQTKLRMSNEILDLAFEVREVYYELVGEIEKVQYSRSIVELTSIQTDIVSKQIAAGNVNHLDFELAQSRFWEAELVLDQSEAEIIRLREKLNRLLGFNEDFFLIFPENLPQEIDYHGFNLCTLESIAIENRLDLQTARFEIIRMSRMLGLKDWWTYTNLNLGLAGEREPGGSNFLGPGFSGELPIFNYGQADRMRLFAQLRQSQERLAELNIRVFSEVREAHKLLMSYSKIINIYRERLLPMQRRISASSEELYNVMGLGVDRLLENKQQEVMAYKNYTESMKKYLLARVKIDRALGGNLFLLLLQRDHVEGVSE